MTVFTSNPPVGKTREEDYLDLGVIEVPKIDILKRKIADLVSAIQLSYPNTGRPVIIRPH